jgi:hypothetical protein
MTASISLRSHALVILVVLAPGAVLRSTAASPARGLAGAVAAAVTKIAILVAFRRI